jgi:histidinol phosphatase-like enzyme
MSGSKSSAGGSATDFSGIKFVFLDRDGVINRKAPDGNMSRRGKTFRS